MVPAASRPDIPGYGIAEAADGEGLLPWAWAVERLASSHGYWVGTVRPDGRPHTAPVWAVWLDDALWFSTGGSTVKARNLARDPRCTVTTASTGEAVILEGTASIATPHPPAVVDAYAAKYATAVPPEEPLYRVDVRVAFGFIDDADRFGATATRWR
jgi:PPOX class probable F420-dependent enzyme